MGPVVAAIVVGGAYWLYQKKQATKEIRRAERLKSASEIVSCLVDQVYAADGGHHEQASKVWESLGYVEHNLSDDQTPEHIKDHGRPSCKIRFKVFLRRDTNIRGTMEEWTAVRPQYVVAIRGTKLRCQKDIIDDLFHLFEMLHSREAFMAISDMTEKTVTKYKAQNVCITGHSLGAAYGLLIGRKLALGGHHVETHLFNPPYLTWEVIIRKLKEALRVLANLVPGPIRRPIRALYDNLIKNVRDPLECILDFERILDSEADKELRDEMEREFSQLQEWIPNLYVNEDDEICNEYLKYFENAEREGPSSSHSASKSSRALRKIIRIQAKSYHLIPSVVLHKKNRRHIVNTLTAHDLNQWYKYSTSDEPTEYHLEILQEDAA